VKVTVFFITLLISAWVFFDAQERGKGIVIAFLWCLGTQLLPIIILPLWLIKRPGKYRNASFIKR
jgi:hypothetical protein